MNNTHIQVTCVRISVLTQIPHFSVAFKQHIEEIDQFMHARGVPKDLRNSVHTYFMTRFPTKHIFDEARILTEFPPSIRRAMNYALYKDLVDSKTGCPLFRMCDVQVIRPSTLNPTTDPR
jgi:hypothetical protein